MGGDNMKHLDLSIFSGRDNVFAIIDEDPGSRNVRKEFIRNCKENGIIYFQLERYAIENYLPLHLIKQEFSGQISKQLTELKNSEQVDKQIGFNKKGKSVKDRIHKIADNLLIEHIQGTDLWEIIEKINSIIKNDSYQEFLKSR